MTTATEGNAPAIDVNQQEYIQYTFGMDQAITHLVDVNTSHRMVHADRWSWCIMAV